VNPLVDEFVPVVLDAAGFVDHIVTVLRMADTVTGRNDLLTEAAYRVSDSLFRGVQMNNLQRGNRTRLRVQSPCKGRARPAPVCECWPLIVAYNRFVAESLQAMITGHGRGYPGSCRAATTQAAEAASVDAGATRRAARSGQELSSGRGAWEEEYLHR